MMLDKVLATLAVLLLIAFLGIVVVFVREYDLAVVIVLVLAMAIHEIWHELRAAAKGRNGSRSN